MSYERKYAEALSRVIGDELTLDQIEALIEKPKHEAHGDLAFPCFQLAKAYRKAPVMIATDIAGELNDELFTKVEAAGPYVNVFLSRDVVSQEIINMVLDESADYATHATRNETIVTDFSSPNIAKPFSMGHLRSTVIGNAINQIARKNGYDVVGINHLGDWGTQFGKLMVAYKKWGDEEAVRANPIAELLKLYVHFHEEAKTQPELEDEGRAWFKKLEDGNEEATELWTWFRDESLKEFQKVYDLLGVEFDSFNGEAFYNDKMDRIVAMLEEKQLLVESEGAMVVSLEDENLPPCLIKKKDGATLYATRDLAAAVYRHETYNFVQANYVVGGEQALHFKQLFSVLRKLGYDFVDGMHHVPFGLILQEGKKMSTRKGRIVLLEEVLKEAIEKAQANIAQKNPELANADDVARMVGVGAVIFHDLKNERINNIEFDLDSMLKFEGETGPYVQYTNARANSLLRKGNYDGSTFAGADDDHTWGVVTMLNAFPHVITRAHERREPSIISRYVLDLAQAFNKYYGHVRVLEEDAGKQSRLALVKAVTIVLTEGLRLIGVQAPEEM
ncbi:arginine--tRNA ligase [Exiguobacterium aurantiacum]|uniref:Arginine--tRNA ligase n=1 Tax=Exiguobacterium aurantiacum TaxID=33987 RepID=A0A377FWZ5_9BACL|nr:arginine--tRNA ligase [Exiguobacterium aurantiacum]STO09351.1 Arginine--tRNA ligase [Exiguobacterium aurantiacum]